MSKRLDNRGNRAASPWRRIIMVLPEEFKIIKFFGESSKRGLELMSDGVTGIWITVQLTGHT